ncbi:MAG: site-2 protease family protein [Deltaproteobacteria bacterium]|nr:site-2 protease family protein [Deltaproteobacteria bacterium]
MARFIALIGALVFVHEFGHFVWAKVFHVKVLKFSLGFGPRVFGVRHLETDYCVSLVPLGGFVKMLGEDPSDPIPPEDLPRAFHSQRLWKRFVIVLAGPVLSLTFPILLYFVVFLGRTELTPPVIGTVVPGFPAEGRLLPGDRVLRANGHAIASFEALREAVAASPGVAVRLELEREGHPLTVELTPEEVTLERPLDVVERVGRAGIASGMALPVVGVREGSAAATAGLKTFDLVIMYAGTPVRRMLDLERAMHQSRGATVPLGYLRPRRVEGALGGLGDLELLEPGLAQLTPEPGTGDGARRTGLESADLYVSDVPAESPEHGMGLRRGARIVSLDGRPQVSWERVREALLTGGRRLRTVRFALEGREAEGAFAVRPERFVDELGQALLRPSFQTEHWVPMVAEARIPSPSPVSDALRSALRETSEALRFTALGLLRLVEGRVPLSTVGGPMMIYDVTRSTAGEGVWGFLWLMALVSINLGLLNLLPIPTLDGGHLLFFAVEAALRRPVPLWVRQAASALGLLFLAVVMVLAFRNDLDRRSVGW